jgi:hypothetical protein
MGKSLSILYEEYSLRYGGNPKYDFGHFIRVYSNLQHYYSIIRPKRIWWLEIDN